MATGHLPFDATTLGDLCQKITKANYVQPSVMNQGVPRDVQNIISRCLKKNPADRYQSARDLLQDVNRVAAGLSSQATQLASSPALTAPSYRPTAYQPPSLQPVAYQAPPLQLDQRSEGPVATKPKSKLPILAAIAAVIVLVVVGGLYFLLSSNPAIPGGSGQSFTVDAVDGRAEVYRNGQRVGTTPYQFQAKSGEELELVLKREGYVDKRVRFTTSENKKMYTFMLEKKK
jgi:serine/threonine-protein kinase